MPQLRVEQTGRAWSLTKTLTTVGRGPDVDVGLLDLSVSPLHAEIVRRGEHVYVSDLGLSANGTRVNGRMVACRVLREGDVIAFGAVRTQITNTCRSVVIDDTIDLRAVQACGLSQRELEVLNALCRPAMQQDAFISPSTAQKIADELVVTEAAIKQHLMRLYAKFGIVRGVNRRTQLANAAINLFVVRPPFQVHERPPVEW